MNFEKMPMPNQEKQSGYDKPISDAELAVVDKIEALLKEGKTMEEIRELIKGQTGKTEK